MSARAWPRPPVPDPPASALSPLTPQPAGRKLDGMPPLRVSVIVPVYNGRLQLPRCLEALRVSTFADFEVIVVDDCSTDNTRNIAENFGARYLRTARNIGPGGGRNLGAAHARGEILLFVDADVVVAPGTLGYVAEDFSRDPGLAAMFGSYDQSPAWPDFLSQYKNLMHHYVHQTAAERAVTFWAGCGAVRAEVFRRFGGFDTEKYPDPSVEDIELGYRISISGGKILLDKRVQVKHLKKWTVRGLLKADIWLRAIPWTRLILETRNLPRDLNLTHTAQASALLVGLLFAGLPLLPLALAGFLPARISPVLLGGSLLAIVGLLLALNWRVYAWFASCRGPLFTTGAVAAHWVYYFYSGCVFALCLAEHFVRPRREAGIAVAPQAAGRPEPHA